MYIGTHNIQDVISSIDVDKFCFQFQYVNGSTANKTHLRFIPANGNQITYNYTTWQLDKLNCIMLPANNWTLYACDDELPCTLNPAVTVTDIVISALSISSDSILSSTHSSTSLVSSIFLTTKESSFISDISMNILWLLNIMHAPIVSGSIITTPSTSPSKCSRQANSVIIGIVIAFISMFFVTLISCKLQYQAVGRSHIKYVAYIQ